MNRASRPVLLIEEPSAPRSLGTLAASIVTCTHPEDRHVGAAVHSIGGGGPVVTWCAACGALRSQSDRTHWQAPSLTSAVTKKHFEDLVLLLHGVVQLGQLTQADASPGAAGSAAHSFLRNLRASLFELSRLPVVRDVDRLEEAIARMTPSQVRPSSG